MSTTSDKERAEYAAEARRERQIAVLEELLRIVRMRREELPVRVIAERIGRHVGTLYLREETADEMLHLLDQKGQRRRT